jgi:hypothetical protein
VARPLVVECGPSSFGGSWPDFRASFHDPELSYSCLYRCLYNLPKSEMIFGISYKFTEALLTTAEEVLLSDETLLKVMKIIDSFPSSSWWHTRAFATTTMKSTNLDSEKF